MVLMKTPANYWKSDCILRMTVGHEENRIAMMVYNLRRQGLTEDLIQIFLALDKEPPVEFGCIRCPQKFPTRELLVDHMVEENKLFPCPNCQKTFADRFRLVDHIYEEHGVSNVKKNVPKKKDQPTQEEATQPGVEEEEEEQELELEQEQEQSLFDD